MKRIILALAIVLGGARAVFAEDAAPSASWSAPSAAEVKAQLDRWLVTQSLSDTQKEQLDALWAANGEGLSGAALLEHVATTLALIDVDAKKLVAFCRAPRTSARLPDFAVLSKESLPPIATDNLRLFYGVWLAQQDMHEEALAHLGELSPSAVADPASLLFYTSVCHHRLRNKDACLPAIAQLLENENAVPRRFRELARLMQADLDPLKPDTLDEIARLMDSIRRRLDLARVGKRVRDEEDQVIAKLDKMIDELEKQRDKTEVDGTPTDAPSNRPPGTPMQDSKAAGLRGKGDVDPKSLKDNGNWGNLPPKDRQEALQQISKELPAHYREAIEEYFRKLAREGDK
jgi:hypothetical protein